MNKKGLTSFNLVMITGMFLLSGLAIYVYLR